MAYKNIAKGVSLAADHAKYITWLNLDTGARQQAFGTVYTPGNRAKITREAGAIIPFNELGSGIAYLGANVISGTNTGTGGGTALALLAIVAPYLLTAAQRAALPGTASVIAGIKKYKFAKVVLSKLITAATAKSTSRITGREYYKNDYDSITAHFGKETASPSTVGTYEEVVAAIKANTAWTTLAASPNKYRFVNELSG
jgi:hypothetical protein